MQGRKTEQREGGDEIGHKRGTNYLPNNSKTGRQNGETHSKSGGDETRNAQLNGLEREWE